MQPPHDAESRHRLIVLHEIHRVPQERDDLLVELALRETLEEIAARVFKNARFQDQYAGDVGREDVHIFSMHFSRYCPYWFLSIGCASSRIRSAEIHPWR